MRPSFSSISLARVMLRARSSVRMYCLMRVLARAVLTNLSQSRLGLRWLSVMISTRSPFFSTVPSGTSRPLTLAPAHWSPTLECTA